MTVEKLSDVVRVKSTRVYEEIVLQIQSLIAQGKLRPGEKLPPERELAERFGAGRNSIREAIRQLELLGLVEARQGEGTFITKATVDNLAAPLLSILVQSPNLIGEIHDFREVLEPRIATMAALRATPEDIAKLEQIFRKIENFASSGDGPVSEAIEYDGLFHNAIAEATHNGLVVRLESAVMDLLKEFRGQLNDMAYFSSVFPDIHRSVLDAIKARDGRLARQAMERHMEFIQGHISEIERLNRPI